MGEGLGGHGSLVSRCQHYSPWLCVALVAPELAVLCELLAPRTMGIGVEGSGFFCLSPPNFLEFTFAHRKTL